MATRGPGNATSLRAYRLRDGRLALATTGLEALAPAGFQLPLPHTLVHLTTPVTAQSLAFSGVDQHGRYGTWTIGYAVGDDTGVQLLPRTLTEVLGDDAPWSDHYCPTCGTLAVSPDARWLIVEGSHGLGIYSLTTSSGAIGTSGEHDWWPSCSPDGQVLAYAHAVQTEQYLALLTTQDCVPPFRAIDPQPVLFALMKVAAAQLTWSGDSQLLAFSAPPANGGAQAVFVVSRDSFARANSTLDLSSASAVSGAGCGHPLWVHSVQPASEVLAYTCTGDTTHVHLVSVATDAAGAAAVSQQASIAVDPSLLAGMTDWCWIP